MSRLPTTLDQTWSNRPGLASIFVRKRPMDAMPCFPAAGERRRHANLMRSTASASVVPVAGCESGTAATRAALAAVNASAAEAVHSNVFGIAAEQIRERLECAGNSGQKPMVIIDHT